MSRSILRRLSWCSPGVQPGPPALVRVSKASCKILLLVRGQTELLHDVTQLVGRDEPLAIAGRLSLG